MLGLSHHWLLGIEFRISGRTVLLTPEPPFEPQMLSLNSGPYTHMLDKYSTTELYP